MKNFDKMRRYLRPSMLQHLLRRLVFDVPILNEYAKMPLKVCLLFILLHFFLFLFLLYWKKGYIYKHNAPNLCLKWSLQILIYYLMVSAVN